MRILYGVAGEGLGHAIRSQVVIEHLQSRGHEVQVMASGRAFDVLAPRFADVHRIQGMHLAFDKQKVAVARTVWSNLRQLAGGVRVNTTAWLDMLAGGEVQRGAAVLPMVRTGTGPVALPRDPPARRPFDPEIVLSDFESWSWLCARLQGLPVISIDNIQAINRCKLPKDLLVGQRRAFEMARTVVKARLPGADHYVVTSFARAKVRKKRTTVVPPLVREAILRAVPSQGDHVLVYQSAGDTSGLTDILRRFPETEFRIYGGRGSPASDERADNLLFRPFSEPAFVSDLASARAVIGGGGFTLMSEAVLLGKPMLAVPLDGHFEQVMNARWLERLGYGRSTESLRKRDVRNLLQHADDYADELRRYQQYSNAEALEVVDGLLQQWGG